MSRHKKTFAPRANRSGSQNIHRKEDEENQEKITPQDVTISLAKTEVTQITYGLFRNRAFKKVENGSVIKFLQKGPHVLILHKALNTLGYKAVGNGSSFWKETKTALINFQQKNGITATGIFNKETLLKMDEVLGKGKDDYVYKNGAQSFQKPQEQIPSLSNANPPEEKVRLNVGIVPVTIKSNQDFFNFLDIQIFGKITDISWDIGNNSYKNYIGKETYCNVHISTLKKYLGITDKQWEDLESKTNSSTSSAFELRKSVEKYLEKVKDREEAINNRDILETKLYGLEEFYKEYREYADYLKTSSLTSNNADFSPLFIIPKWQGELDKKAKKYGFKNLTDFETTINKYLDAFRSETVRLAEDYIDKYEHLLYKEEERLKKEDIMRRLYTTFYNSGASKNISEGKEKEYRATTMFNKTGSVIMEERKLELHREGEEEIAQGVEKIKTLNSFIFKDKTFDYKEMGDVNSQKDFEKILLDFIKSKRENAHKVRQDLKDNPDAIYKQQELLQNSYQKQGVIKNSIIDLIIQQKISDIQWTEILINIGLAIASIIAIVATLGQATPYVIAGAAVSFGISAYGVYEALDEYYKKDAAYEIGLLKDKPSLVWVVVAIAGAALDAASLATVLRLAKPITEAAELFNKSAKSADDILTLKTSLAKIEDLSTKVQANIVKQAELTAEFRNTAQEFLHAIATFNSGINPAALPKLIRLADLGIKRGIVSFKNFLLELQLQKVIKNAENLSPEELKILKEAFTEAKAGKANFLDDLAKNLSEKYKNFLEQRNLTVIKPKGANKNLDILDDAGRIIFRGTEEQIEKYVAFMSKSASEREAIVNATKDQLRNNTRFVYNPEITKAKGYDIPISSNGTSPDFKGLKMYLNEQGKLGNGITSIPGVSDEIFTDALNKIIKFDGQVKIPITGVERPADFANAWKAMGIEPSIGSKILTKLKLTWHHLDDLDGNLKGTMQLIIRDIHEKTLPHMGSHVQIKTVLGIN